MKIEGDRAEMPGAIVNSVILGTMTADEAVELIEAIIEAARKEVIDKVFELSPTAQFKDWKPQDALAFYERLKAYEQELSHPAPEHESDKE